VSQPTTEGVARLVADLVAAQRARGWQVAVACPPQGWLPETVEGTGATHLAWEARRSPGPWVANETVRLGKVVDRADPEVVHLHSSKAGLAGRLSLRGSRPTMFQPHAWSFQVGGAMASLARAWERTAARWTDLFVCCGHAELDAGRAAGVRGAAEVVSNSIDVGRYAAAGEAERAISRERLGLGDEPLVACVGRLSPQKGQDLLLDAWPDVLAAVPAATLALVGDGPDREALASRGLPQVLFLGSRDDVADWLAAANVVAVPSRYDCPSLALLEALARERPAVAHAVGGMLEVMAPEGHTVGGALVPLGDRRALAEAIATRLLDPELAASEGRAGRLIVERNHNLDGWAERLCSLTERVAAERRPG
jgi:glycosyltransferase involved in cell wall biosynthesis